MNPRNDSFIRVNNKTSHRRQKRIITKTKKPSHRLLRRPSPNRRSRRDYLARAPFESSFPLPLSESDSARSLEPLDEQDELDELSFRAPGSMVSPRLAITYKCFLKLKIQFEPRIREIRFSCSTSKILFS
ncbi:hypothetical protein L596_024517 [Steinernema carpocapsae]|uniref:Uncharacterized protein n=1 Tax=Steinernema carpocapsae TaxID=34508 RepID=A0A4U5MHA0_STECR|nr:hypothetical protein L596_024517 [Steinernema carpocapsae]